jgi:hypothetical protein
MSLKMAEAEQDCVNTVSYLSNRRCLSAGDIQSLYHAD